MPDPFNEWAEQNMPEPIQRPVAPDELRIVTNPDGTTAFSIVENNPQNRDAVVQQGLFISYVGIHCPHCQVAFTDVEDAAASITSARYRGAAVHSHCFEQHELPAMQAACQNGCANCQQAMPMPVAGQPVNNQLDAYIEGIGWVCRNCWWQHNGWQTSP